jgi:membrane-associated progesterone receptor component
MDLVSQTVSVLLIWTHVFGTDGMYGNFAGRDASRGMAKQSFDKGKMHLSDPYPYCLTDRISATTDVLTPIDQPLDKLTDLQVDEMYGSSIL